MTDHRESRFFRGAVPPLESWVQSPSPGLVRRCLTTRACVRLLGNLFEDREVRPHVVPIVADEARTFGTANVF